MRLHLNCQFLALLEPPPSQRMSMLFAFGYMCLRCCSHWLDKAVTGELRCVMAYAEGHVSSVPACVVDAMRYHLSVGERGVVMVVHLHRLSGVGTAVVPSEIAKHLLLLRVHAEYGNACLFARSSQLLNIAELFVTVFALCHGQGLYRLAAGISLGTDDLPDDIEAYI